MIEPALTPLVSTGGTWPGRDQDGCPASGPSRGAWPEPAVASGSWPEPAVARGSWPESAPAQARGSWPEPAPAQDAWPEPARAEHLRTGAVSARPQPSAGLLPPLADQGRLDQAGQPAMPDQDASWGSAASGWSAAAPSSGPAASGWSQSGEPWPQVAAPLEPLPGGQAPRQPDRDFVPPESRSAPAPGPQAQTADEERTNPVPRMPPGATVVPRPQPVDAPRGFFEPARRAGHGAGSVS